MNVPMTSVASGSAIMTTMKSADAANVAQRQPPRAVGRTV
jgi:hypothetical protein